MSTSALPGVLSTSGLAAGGSLKKDSVLAAAAAGTPNLNLLSTTNEAKAAAAAGAAGGGGAGGPGAKPPLEVKQQIPVKLSSKLSSSSSSSSSIGRDKAGKRISTAAAPSVPTNRQLHQPASLTASGGLSGSLSNISAGRALSEAATAAGQQQQPPSSAGHMQQILPFKLSEAAASAGEPGRYWSHLVNLFFESFSQPVIPFAGEPVPSPVEGIRGWRQEPRPTWTDITTITTTSSSSSLFSTDSSINTITTTTSLNKHNSVVRRFRIRERAAHLVRTYYSLAWLAQYFTQYYFFEAAPTDQQPVETEDKIIYF